MVKYKKSIHKKMSIKYTHGNNIQTKKTTKYGKEPYLSLLEEIENEYNRLRADIEKIKGNKKEDVYEKTDLINKYYKFLRQEKFNIFDSRSKLHSTVLEEFCSYLFNGIKDFSKYEYDIGQTKAYTNMSFSPKNFEDFHSNSGVFVSEKDQDFVISKKIKCFFQTNESQKIKESKKISVPVIAIECKTYIDKTMFDGSCQAAEKLKAGNPFSLILIVAETNQIGKEINVNHSRIDQIYILRKESAENPIDKELVWDLFVTVKNHLEKDWFNPEEAIKNGKLITRS